MPYDYDKERVRIFTDQGQRDFLEMRDRVRELLKVSGAFMLQNAFGSGSTWEQMAYVDRMVEIGELRELTAPDSCAGQHRVFVSA